MLNAWTKAIATTIPFNVIVFRETIEKRQTTNWQVLFYETFYSICSRFDRFIARQRYNYYTVLWYNYSNIWTLRISLYRLIMVNAVT